MASYAIHGFGRPLAFTEDRGNWNGHGNGVGNNATQLTAVDAIHVLHVDEVASARGGNGGGGTGGGGGGTTTFSPYTSGPTIASNGFNITITFTGTWTQAYYDVFKAAADFYTSLIIGDLPDISIRSRGRTTTIDDIVISAELGAIDGVNGILGQAGPTSVRTDSSLPAQAQMKFDIADVDAMGLAAFADVVMHEMAHALGFGSIWGRVGLVTNNQYTGAAAVAEFQNLGGTGFIPVETDGGQGTAGSHWDEEFFDNELMTGYINDDNRFSAMSAASFSDLGYEITPSYLALVESYSIPGIDPFG